MDPVIIAKLLKNSGQSELKDMKQKKEPKNQCTKCIDILPLKAPAILIMNNP